MKLFSEDKDLLVHKQIIFSFILLENYFRATILLLSLKTEPSKNNQEYTDKFTDLFNLLTVNYYDASTQI